jgi:putative oxidoreductase
MDTLTKTISKFMFAIPFLVFGYFHLSNLDGMSFLVPSYFPAAKFWVALTGISLIAASISIIVGIWDVWASFLLGVMLLLFALLVHLSAVMGGNEMSMPNLLKDLSLSGAAWMYSGFIAKSKKFKK